MDIISLVCIIVISIGIGIFIGALLMYRTWKEIYKNDAHYGNKQFLHYMSDRERTFEGYYREAFKLPKNIIVTYGEKEIAKKRISEIIAYMIMKNASGRELKQAIQYSLIVMDSEKYNLDISKAYKDYRIEDLKRKYSS